MVCWERDSLEDKAQTRRHNSSTLSLSVNANGASGERRLRNASIVMGLMAVGASVVLDSFTDSVASTADLVDERTW
jgi:hypothetical protein